MKKNTILISDLARLIWLHSFPGCKPLLVISDPGMGKTTALNHFCRQHNYDPYVFMLNQFSPVDLKGYLVPDKETRRMVSYPSAEIPWSEDGRPYADTHNGRRPLILLDEFLSATTGVGHIAQQLVLERRIGEWHLPPDALIVAAANGAAMKCGSNKITMSLADRFAIYHIRPDAKATLDWMVGNGVNHWIVAFINVQMASGGGVLWSTPPEKWTGEEPIDSARSYTALSTVFASPEGKDILTSSLLPAVCAAHIGEASGTKLAEFIRLSLSVGNIDDLINNPDNADIPTNPSLRWSIAACCVMRSTKTNFANILKLAKRLTPPELAPKEGEPTAFEAFVVRSVIQTCPQIISGNAPFLAWIKAYGEFVKSAQ